MREVREALEEAGVELNGTTLLKALRSTLAARDKTLAELREALGAIEANVCYEHPGDKGCATCMREIARSALASSATEEPKP